MNKSYQAVDCKISPTLRIVLTNKCNGKCFFCHREGYPACNDGNLSMDLEIIKNGIIPAIHDAGISKVVFTGGEPTLYEQLPEALRIMKESCDQLQVEMTSNGYRVEKILDREENIDKITISVSSLKKEIFMKYTMIDPYVIVDRLAVLKNVKKAVSIVITQENCGEIEEMVSFFLNHGFDIKLQFVIMNGQTEDEWEREVLHKLFSVYGDFSVRLGGTPVLVKKMNDTNEIRIKLASLNKWMYENIFIRKECSACVQKEQCVERGCSIRVFPDGRVTPCLNYCKIFDSGSVKDNIVDAYKCMALKSS